MEEGEASTSDDRADSTSSLSGPGGRARHHRHRQGAGGDDEEGASAAAADDYPHRYRPRFRRGDVVKLYNTESSDVQIAFPSIVMGYDYRAPVETSHDNDTAGSGGEGIGGGEGAGGYRVTRTTDGREITGLHERHVHPYVLYGIGDEALCNIGTYPGSGLRGGNRGDGVGGRGRGGGRGRKGRTDHCQVYRARVQTGRDTGRIYTAGRVLGTRPCLEGQRGVQYDVAGLEVTKALSRKVMA